MSPKRATLVVVITCLFLLAFAGTASASGGEEPAVALHPDGSWQALGPGESMWFVFNYDGGEGAIDIEFDAVPSDGAAFSLLTPEQMKLYQTTGKLEAIGRGAYNEFVSADLFWCGSFNSAGKYYIVVEDNTSRAEPTYFSLEAMGDGVSMPPTAVETKEAAVKVAAAAAVEPKVDLAPPAGKGVDDALVPEGEWMEIGQGETHWYAFDYDGQEGQIQVRLKADPADDIRFSVRTPEDVRKWQTTGEVEACGCGTINKLESSGYYWTGEFNSPGTYYVVVEETGQKDGGSVYALEVIGSGVS